MTDDFGKNKSKLYKPSALNWLIGIGALVWGADILWDGRSAGRVPGGGVIDYGQFAPVIGSVLILLGIALIGAESYRLISYISSPNNKR